MVSVDKPILDTLHRTMDNLAIIDESYAESGQGWKVTQLINSFAGVVLYPWEEWRKELKAITLGSEEGARWPTLVARDPRDVRPETVGDLVGLIRNAFAHGNINFHSSPTSKEIESLTIWNTNQNSGLRTWAATIDISTLRRILKAMEETVSDFREPSQKSMPTHHAERPGTPKPLCIACGQKVKSGNHRYETWLASQPIELIQSD